MALSVPCRVLDKTAGAVSHHAVLTVRPPNAEPLLLPAEVNAYSTSDRPCGPTFSAVALRWLAEAATTATSPGQLRDPSPVVHAAAALILLVVALTLSVYKPRGMTGYGLRRSRRTATGGREAVGAAP